MQDDTNGDKDEDAALSQKELGLMIRYSLMRHLESTDKWVSSIFLNLYVLTNHITCIGLLQ